MAKRSSVRSKENSPDLTPFPENKSGSKKKPYIFTRAFARLLNLDQEQAVAGYLASTSPGEPNHTLPETAAPPHASAPSDSNTGRPIIPNGAQVRKLETANPNIKLPPARVTESASTQGKSDRVAILSNPTAPSDPSAGRPITPNGVHIRKVTEISKSPNTKSLSGRVTESAPARGKGDLTSIPEVNRPSDSSTGRPIAQKKLQTNKAMEMPSPANLALLLLGAARARARVTESAPTQGEGGRASSLRKAKAASDNTGRPIIQSGVEIRKGTEIPTPTSMELPPSPQIQAKVVESAPAQGESGRASSLPKAKTASDNTGRPIIQSGVEIRKGTEIPTPTSMELPPSPQIQAREAAPAQGEGGRTSNPPKTNAASDSSSTRPIAPGWVQILKGTEMPTPTSMKLPPSAQIQARVVESAPAPREGGQASSLPKTNAASDSSSTRPITQGGVQILKGTEIPSPANMKRPPSPQIKAKVVESAPVEESRPASPVPNANPPSDSSTGQPIIQNRVEIRKFVEVPNPNIKFRAGELAESAPVEQSGPANPVPNANPPSDSSTGQPIIQNRVEIRKFVEVPNPNIKQAGELTESALAQGESSRATSLPKTNESSTTQPSTQEGVEVREVTIPNLSKMKAPPVAQIQERIAILVLVVALGVAVWGFFTRRTDTRVIHPVPPDSNSSASVASSDAQMPFSNKASGSSASRGMASFVVGIKARKNVWVSIRADGRKLSEEKLTSGAEKSVTAANQVMVKTGNAGALDFEFNGKKVPSQATSGDVRTLEFGPSGLEVVISQPSTRMKPGK
jgi:Domain of unknown function (DUF4115)